VPLLIDRKPRWVELTLNRPDNNVLDREMLDALVQALKDLEADGAPALLLRANGRRFSTGYSIGDIPEEIFHRDEKVRRNHPFEETMERLVHYPAPVVAAVQGDAYGGAVELLACTDMRVAASQVRVGVPPVRLGLVYSHTGLRRMLRGFGSPMVREMLLTGDAIPARRVAVGGGFFNRLTTGGDLMISARGLMQRIGCGAPGALKGTRRILNLLEETELLPDPLLEEIACLRHDSWSSDEFRVAREAFLAREPSPFCGDSKNPD